MEYNIELTRSDTPDMEGFDFSRPISILIEATVNKSESGKILVIYPGFNSDAAGYNEKYKKVDEFISQKLGVSVVRSSNYDNPAFNFTHYSLKNLRLILEYVRSNSKDICGKDVPEIYLFGISVGASVAAMVAHEYGDIIRKLLLVAPGLKFDHNIIKDNISKYEGELHIAVGSEDVRCSFDNCKLISTWARGAKKKKAIEITYCDHQFKGKVNGMILSKLPLWAFGDAKIDPHTPEDGIVLYHEGDPLTVTHSIVNEISCLQNEYNVIMEMAAKKKAEVSIKDADRISSLKDLYYEVHGLLAEDPELREKLLDIPYISCEAKKYPTLGWRIAKKIAVWLGNSYKKDFLDKEIKDIEINFEIGGTSADSLDETAIKDFLNGGNKEALIKKIDEIIMNKYGFSLKTSVEENEIIFSFEKKEVVENVQT